MLDLFEIEVVLISKTHCIQKVEHSVWMEYLIRVKYTIKDLPIESRALCLNGVPYKSEIYHQWLTNRK